MLEILYLLIFLNVTYSIGKQFLLLLNISLGNVEELLVCIALGSGFLIYFTFLLGIFSVIYTQIYFILILLVYVLFYKDIFCFYKLIYMLLINTFKKLRFNKVGILFYASLFFIAINFIVAFAPVSEIDSTTYHLAFAKIYGRHHGLIFQPSQLYTVMPQGMSMLYTIAELFSGGTLSILIAYIFSLLSGLCIYEI